jgi:hypothetical protein
MSTDAHHELLSFHNFVAQQIQLGIPYSSPEEAVEAWRLRNRTPEEMAEDVQAVREALSDMEAGDRGTPAEVYLAEFGKRHNLSPDR